jgi:hypothetical protein
MAIPLSAPVRPPPRPALRANTHSGGTVAAAGTLVIRHVGAVGSGGLRVQAGATVMLDVGIVELPLASLVVEPGGRIDLGTGRITVAGGGLPAADAVALITSGRGDGSWNGASGFVTRSAVSDSGLGIGFAVNGDGSTTIAFAAAGDLSLDGQIDILDISAFLGAATLDTAVSGGWVDGDFNYDGFCDALDIGAFLATGFFEQGSYLPAAAAENASLSAAAAAFASLADMSPPTSRRKLFATIP